MTNVQLNIFQSSANRDEGIALAIDHADSNPVKWSDSAYEFLKKFLSNHNGPFMVEEIRSYAALMDFPLPPNARAWGGIIVRAAGDGIVERCGYQQTRNVKAHRTPAALWRQIKNV